MSKSKKKIPIFTYIGYSNKISKRFCNRRFRKAVRMAVKQGKTPPTNLNEIMSEYCFLGDGKHYIKEAPSKYMRK